MIEPHGKIKIAIEDILAQSGRPQTVLRDTPLFSSGLLDSIAGVELILFLEQEFYFDFLKNNIEMIDIDSILKIESLIVAYQFKAGAQASHS